MQDHLVGNILRVFLSKYFLHNVDSHFSSCSWTLRRYHVAIAYKLVLYDIAVLDVLLLTARVGCNLISLQQFMLAKHARYRVTNSS